MMVWLLAFLLSSQAHAEFDDFMMNPFAQEQVQACEMVARPKDCAPSTMSLGRAQSFLQNEIISCKASYQANNCKQLEANPANKDKLTRCDEKGVCQTYAQGFGKCALDKLHMAEDAVKALMDAAMKLPSMTAATPQMIRDAFAQIGETIWKSYSTQKDCNANLKGEKKAMLDAYNAQLEPVMKERWQITGTLATDYQELSCTQISQRLQGRMIDHNREFIGKFQSGELKLDPRAQRNQTDFLMLLKAVASQLKQKANCYNAPTKAEIICNGALVIASMAMAPAVGAAIGRGLSILVSRGILTGSQADWIALLASVGSPSAQNEEKLMILVGSHKRSFEELTDSLAPGMDRKAIDRRVHELAEAAHTIRKEIPELANLQRSDEGGMISLISLLKGNGVPIDKIRERIRASLLIEGEACAAY